MEYLEFILLFLSGIGAFVLSTVAGGGGALILVPALNWAIGTAATAPVLSIGTLIGRPSRLVIFWSHIRWKVSLFYIPTAVIGAWIAGFLFSNIRLEELQIVVGIFLISTLFQYRFGKAKRSFEMKLIYFAPLGFIVSMLSTLIGAMGPVLNPFYLNSDLTKEEITGTKTANSLIMGLSQLGSYSYFNLIDTQIMGYAVALGMGALLGNIIGKRYLVRMKTETFRKWVIAVMVISGVLMIVRNLF